jgi:hypothetical protein
MTWWKMARLVDANGSELARSEIWDTIKAGALTPELPVGRVRDGFLELWKAKFLGVHTAMYRLRIAEIPDRYVGVRVVLDWRFDHFVEGEPETGVR